MLTVSAIVISLYVILMSVHVGYRLGFDRGQRSGISQAERLLGAQKEAFECSQLADRCEASAEHLVSPMYEVLYTQETFEKLRQAGPKAPDKVYPEDDDL